MIAAGVLMALISVAVMSAWWGGYTEITSFGGHFVTIKWLTAFCGFLSAIALLFAKSERMAPLTVALHWALIAINYALLNYGPDAHLPFSRHDGLLQTTIPGMPSVGTAWGFLSIGFYGLVYHFHNGISAKLMKAITGIVWCLAVVAIVGYLVNQPFLYWWFPGQSTGMSPITILIFILAAFAMGELVEDRERR